MKEHFRYGVAFLLLAVYLPVTLLIGLLHTDGVAWGGLGNQTFEKSTSPAIGGKVDDRNCLACLFAAGHVLEVEAPLPWIPAYRFVFLYSPLPAAEIALRLASVRAPPSHLS